MSKCILIAAPQMESFWREAFAAAHLADGVRVIFVSGEDHAREQRDGNCIFVASDKRFLAPRENAQRAVLFQGVGLFDGLEGASCDDARIHVIEMSRYAAEALDWGRGAPIYSEVGTQLSVFPGCCLHVPLVSTSPSARKAWRDSVAEKALQHLCSANAIWPAEVFLFEHPEVATSNGFSWRDFTGPPSPLIRGPYIWASPGLYKISAHFALDEDASRQELQIRWGPPLTPTVLNVTPGRPGVYEVAMEGRWFEPDGMELTIAKVHSAVSGHYAFVEARIEKIDLKSGAS